MQVRDAIKERKSIRAFKNKKLSQQQLETLMLAAQLAPSAHNWQPYKIIIVEEQELKEKLAAACYDQDFIAEASVAFIGIADVARSRWAEIDLAIAFEHIVLQAVELGLGSCWVGAFSEREIKKLLEIPERLKVVAVLPVGFPEEKPRERRKKAIEEIFSFNKLE